jgi:succinyl-diaminopimelate desuccinylase
MDVISLTRELLSFNNINPPGNEAQIARHVGVLLEKNGFSTEYYAFGENRLHLIAEKGLSPTQPPIVLSGHFDTVPLGASAWSVDPFTGIIKDNKIWGRGSSDMKGGVAAMICAAIDSFKESSPAGGIRLIFTAGEESGCQGIQQLVNEMKNPGQASALIIGEPTANLPAVGHKGALYLNAVTRGVTAHSSMPELGINAIYKAAASILKVMNFRFEAEKDELLGYPTINVGKIAGGQNINSVPDHAEFTIDIRSTTKIVHDEVLKRLKNELDSDTKFDKLVDLHPVATNENDPFVMLVYNICGIEKSSGGYPKALPYVTDGSVLQKMYRVPAVILGPGQPEMAHQTDEFCYLNKLEQSVDIYKKIILKWRN